MTNRSKMWLKPTEQMDLWLETKGYYRKHTARDGTCLFRAVAEQLFLTQSSHLEVRRQCVNYVLLFDEKFKNKLPCSLKEYEDRMRISTEWGGDFELEVMSMMYKCDFLVFQEVGKPAENVTNRGFKKKVMLCVSQEKHYDSVYTKQHIANTAYCQSLVYEQLYKRAFGLLEVDFAVKKMLHDKAPRYQREPSCMSINGMALRLEMRDTCLNVKELLLLGVTPFPYKVAKSLDPEIYRNVEYDTWNDYRKGLRYGSRVWSSNELCVGVKCLIKLENDKQFHGFVQEMEPDKGPVLVFIEELGEKRSVPYESLELLPQSQPQPSVPLPSVKQLRQIQAARMALHAQPDSTTQKKPQKNNGNRQKCKDLHENDKRINSCDSTNDQQSLLSSNHLASASSDCYEQELDYQQDMYDNYQHSHMYPTQSCEVTSSSIDHEDDHGVNMSSCAAPVSHYPSNANPNNNSAYQISSSNNPAYCAVNIVPTRSVHPDGSDLPMADLPTLRYYYNIGLDYMRMNYVVQPTTRTATAHCYPVIQSPTQYLQDAVPVSYVSYEQPQPVPAGYPETMPVTLVRTPMPMSTGVNTMMTEPDSSSSASASRNAACLVAPRFKNKKKNENQNQCSSPPQSGNNQHPVQSIVTMNGNDSRHRSPNVVQQSLPSCAVATSPAPAQIPPVSAHYVPVQPSYSPTAAVVPPAVYYHPVECDRNYCPVGTPGGYVEYNVYDHSALYPTAVYSPQTVPQTSYMTTDGLYYQPVVQPTTIEY